MTRFGWWLVSEQTQPRKAYIVTEAMKGESVHLVYANSIREIRENCPAVEREGIDAQSQPSGIRGVHRAPSDDR